MSRQPLGLNIFVTQISDDDDTFTMKNDIHLHQLPDGSIVANFKPFKYRYNCDYPIDSHKNAYIRKEYEELEDFVARVLCICKRKAYSYVKIAISGKRGKTRIDFDFNIKNDQSPESNVLFNKLEDLLTVYFTSESELKAFTMVDLKKKPFVEIDLEEDDDVISVAQSKIDQLTIENMQMKNKQLEDDIETMSSVSGRAPLKKTKSRGFFSRFRTAQ